MRGRVLEELDDIAAGGVPAIVDEVMAWREAHGHTEEWAARMVTGPAVGSAPRRS